VNARHAFVAGLLALATAACGGRGDVEAMRCAAPADIVGRQVLIPAGAVVRQQGGRFQPEEAAMRDGATAAFTIDATEVTNAQFAAFVAETGYTTTAERLQPDGRRAGGAVFDRTTRMWRLDPDADWRRPLGRGSSIAGLDRHPVVQVSFEDAQAYARWRGRRLPTELEWERAARLDAAAPNDREAEAYAGDGAPIANTWQGAFPLLDAARDGFAGTAPVGCFPPTATGLYDAVGNVWEWTTDWYSETSSPGSEAAAREADPEHLAKRVIKGGSHLCAPNFCARYRSRSRQGGDPGLGTSHIGFRTVGPAPL
jgi:formylglycine-generating enzyme required for sulfatase activity